jgi:hypothetical protein
LSFYSFTALLISSVNISEHIHFVKSERSLGLMQVLLHRPPRPPAGTMSSCQTATSGQTTKLDQWLTKVLLGDAQWQEANETSTAMLPNRESEMEANYAEVVPKRRFKGEEAMRGDGRRHRDLRGYSCLPRAKRFEP